MQKILVTGVAGKTGQTIIQKLAQTELTVYGMVQKQSDSLNLIHASNIIYVEGDFESDAGLFRCLKGMDSVYHICPNMAPDELEIGKRMLKLAQKANISHFVYHSVMHPQIQEMQHHWNKLLVEEQVFKSGIPFTIIQPAAYMQNLLGYWKTIFNDGVYRVPYSPEAKFTNVDLEDLAEAVTLIMQNPARFSNGIYELVGPDTLSSAEMIEIVSSILGREVRIEMEDLILWEKSMRARNSSEYAIKTLLGMFDYYDKHGFVGNSSVLKWIIGREPTHFDSFVHRIIGASR